MPRFFKQAPWQKFGLREYIVKQQRWTCMLVKKTLTTSSSLGYRQRYPVAISFSVNTSPGKEAPTVRVRKTQVSVTFTNSRYDNSKSLESTKDWITLQEIALLLYLCWPRNESRMYLLLFRYVFLALPSFFPARTLLLQSS